LETRTTLASIVRTCISWIVAPHCTKELPVVGWRYVLVNCGAWSSRIEDKILSYWSQSSERTGWGNRYCNELIMPLRSFSVLIDRIFLHVTIFLILVGLAKFKLQCKTKWSEMTASLTDKLLTISSSALVIIRSKVLLFLCVGVLICGISLNESSKSRNLRAVALDVSSTWI
jgi:hypothetical protein